MNKLIIPFFILISFAFTNARGNKEEQINAMYSTEPIGHAYGYYVFEGNKVGRYMRNVGTFYREGTYIINAHDSVIEITYTKVAISKYPFKKARNNYDDQKFETLVYRIAEKDSSYVIDGLELVEEKSASNAASDIKSIRKGSTIKKSIK